MWKAVAAIALTGAAASALAQEERDYCPARPGLGTPTCTISPGRVSAEIGLADWTRDDTPDAREDVVLVGDTLVRIGVSDALEVQIGWTPFGHDHLREKASGAVNSRDRVGDALIGAKLNLTRPDGGGASIAIRPYITLPVGRAPIGSSDWSAGLVVPLSFDLSERLNLQFSPEVDAAVDEDGSGRHLAWSGTAGLGLTISDPLSAALELQVARDEDPAGESTQVLGGLSVGWMPLDDLQLDAGANIGLNGAAPDVQLYFGVSRLF